MNVCLIEDDYVLDKQDNGQVIWIAGLSDGTSVYQDDGRGAPAWIRLAHYVRSRGLFITHLNLKFRSNVVSPVPNNAQGYFFCKQLLRTWSDVNALGFYLVGHLTDELLLVQSWKVPELILFHTETREPALAGECLIRNAR